MKPGDKLPNGAIIVSVYMSVNRNFVLADWSNSRHAKFVTWEIDNNKNTYHGHYLEEMDLAQKDLCDRIVKASNLN